MRRTKKSLSRSYEQIKEFSDFQFNYFPLKSEKKKIKKKKKKKEISFNFSIH